MWCFSASQLLCWSSPPITADHQPIAAYPKLGRTLHRFLLVSIPDLFSSRPNIKEKSALARETNIILSCNISCAHIINKPQTALVTAIVHNIV